MNINQLIKAARSEYDALVSAECETVLRLYNIGKLTNEAVALAETVTLPNGKNVKVKSANAFSVAAGISQSSVSRGVRLVAAFPSSKAAIAAYKASSFGSVQEFITSLSSKDDKDDKGGTPEPKAVVKVRFDKGAKVDDLAAVLKATLTPAQLKALRSRI